MESEILEQTPMTEPELPSPTAEEPVEMPLQPEDVTDRLAAEWILLAEEFPQLTDLTCIPDGVLDTAAREGIPLLDAYLRHRWQEEKKVAAATQTRRQAAQSSAGSLSRGAVEVPPEQDAFLRAFRSAL